MRFLSLYRPGTDADDAPSAEQMMALGKLVEGMMRSGVLLATEGLLSSAHGARVRVDGDGMFDVEEGPFGDPNDVVAGYAIIQVPSLDEAIEVSKQFLAAMGGGENEIRLMFDPQAPDRQLPKSARPGATR